MTKEWKAGIANEAWKVIISARDYSNTEQALNHIMYVLTDAGNDFKKGINLLSEMSGKEIINGLLDYQMKSHTDVVNGIKSNLKKGNIMDGFTQSYAAELAAKGNAAVASIDAQMVEAQKLLELGADGAPVDTSPVDGVVSDQPEVVAQIQDF